MPGEIGEVSINFNSWKDGIFSKKISVFTSADNYPEKLFISANVIDPLKEEGEEEIQEKEVKDQNSDTNSDSEN